MSSGSFAFPVSSASKPRRRLEVTAVVVVESAVAAAELPSLGLVIADAGYAADFEVAAAADNVAAFVEVAADVAPDAESLKAYLAEAEIFAEIAAAGDC